MIKFTTYCIRAILVLMFIEAVIDDDKSEVIFLLTIASLAIIRKIWQLAKQENNA